MENRRTFLVRSSAAAAAALIPSSVLARSGNPAHRLGELTCNQFVASVHTAFAVSDADGRATTLELIQVEVRHTAAAHRHHPDGYNEKFSLLFRGDSTHRLEQNTYTFAHGRLGEFEMFITPVGRAGPEYCQYEAVFNRPPRRRSSAL